MKTTIKEIKSELMNGKTVENAFPNKTDDISDGYHSFGQLYHQRAVLFAVIVNAHKDKAWKSWKHEDGVPCFSGGWFVVGVNTPKGQYTYHYSKQYWDMFKCKEIENAPHWDGHTEEDVYRLFSL